MNVSSNQYLVRRSSCKRAATVPKREIYFGGWLHLLAETLSLILWENYPSCMKPAILKALRFDDSNVEEHYQYRRLSKLTDATQLVLRCTAALQVVLLCLEILATEYGNLSITDRWAARLLISMRVIPRISMLYLGNRRIKQIVFPPNSVFASSSALAPTVTMFGAKDSASMAVLWVFVGYVSTVALTASPMFRLLVKAMGFLIHSEKWISRSSNNSPHFWVSDDSFMLLSLILLFSSIPIRCTHAFALCMYVGIITLLVRCTSYAHFTLFPEFPPNDLGKVHQYFNVVGETQMVAVIAIITFFTMSILYQNDKTARASFEYLPTNIETNVPDCFPESNLPKVVCQAERQISSGFCEDDTSGNSSSKDATGMQNNLVPNKIPTVTKNEKQTTVQSCQQQYIPSKNLLHTGARTNAELLMLRLSEIQKKFKFNKEVISTVDFAMRILELGADSLFALDPSSLCLKSDFDAGTGRPGTKSEVRRYIDSINMGQTLNATTVRELQRKGIEKTMIFGLQTNINMKKLMDDEDLIGIWNMNAFHLYKVSHGHPLSTVVMAVNDRCGLASALEASRTTVLRLISRIEGEYRNLPYHNCVHAADVTNSYYYLLQVTGWLERIHPVDLASCILAAASHDVSHPGQTNAFLVNVAHPLAIRYNDKSVLENMHAATVFELMADKQLNVLGNLSKSDWRIARSIITELILETDMQRHFASIATFRAHFAKHANWGQNAEDWDEDWDSRLLMFKFLMKCSDLSHAGKKRYLHVRWSRLILEEFFLQGDAEKQQNMLVSPLCDRETVNREKSQIEFLQVLCFPMFEAFSGICKCPKLNEDILEELHQNVAYWEWRRVNRNEANALSNGKHRSNGCQKREQPLGLTSTNKGFAHDKMKRSSMGKTTGSKEEKKSWAFLSEEPDTIISHLSRSHLRIAGSNSRSAKSETKLLLASNETLYIYSICQMWWCTNCLIESVFDEKANVENGTEKEDNLDIMPVVDYKRRQLSPELTTVEETSTESEGHDAGFA